MKVTMVHDGGSKREVTYLGIGGDPPRAMIQWPLAGVYEVSASTGRIVPLGEGARSPKGDALRKWKMISTDMWVIRRDYEKHLTKLAIPVDEGETSGTLRKA